MEEKAVLRVRDRISAALTVPYVRRAVWLMAGGLAGFLTARGLVFGKYAPFAAAGAAAAPFSTMWAVILGGAVGYLFPSPWISPRATSRLCSPWGPSAGRCRS